MAGEVQIERHDGWVELVLNRPETRNAIDGPLADAFADALAELNAATDLAAIVLRGAGGAFCSGLDIKQFNADPPPAWLHDFGAKWRVVHRGLFECPHALVGALERYAINGGAALALACDYLVVGNDAFLQIGEVRLGMGAPYNLAWMRLRHGEALASSLALSGRRVAGEELRRLGLAQESVDGEAVVERACELAVQMASYPAGSVQRIKSLARTYSTDESADEWFDRATRLATGGGRPGRVG